MTLDVGVIGLGAVAQAVHLPLLARRPDLFRIAAVCDLSTELLESLGGRFGVPAERRYLRYQDLLGSVGLDAVLLLARGSHAQMVGEAWKAGLAVFTEKPLAYTTAEVDALGTVTSPPPTMVGYMKQYDPAVQAAAEVVAGIDDVRHVEATVLHPPGAVQLETAHLVGPTRPLAPEVERELAEEEQRLRELAVGEADTGTWRAYRGSLVSSLAHDLSILRSLGHPPATVDHADVWRMSSVRQSRDPGRDRRSFGDHPPSISAVGTLAGGGRYSLGWHYLPDFPAYRETVRVVHGGGSVELAFPSPYLLNAPTELVVRDLDGEAERIVHRRSVSEAFDRQLEAFHALVQDGVPPATGLAGGRQDILDCQRILAAFVGRTGLHVGGEVGALVSGSGTGGRR